MLADAERMTHTVPYTLHGDDVRVHNNSKVYVITCSSALTRAPSKVSRLLVTAFLSRLSVKRTVGGRVLNQSIDEIHQTISHSSHCLLEGRWPRTDYKGRPFSGFRVDMAGRPLAGPWRAAFSHMRGDLEFKARAFNWPNYACHFLCHLCPAHKGDDPLCFTDLSPGAPCFQISYSHEDYLWNCACMGSYRSPFLQLPGFRKERVLEDWMHDVHLGCASHLSGSALVELCGGRRMSRERVAP